VNRSGSDWIYVFTIGLYFFAFNMSSSLEKVLISRLTAHLKMLDQAASFKLSTSETPTYSWRAISIAFYLHQCGLLKRSLGFRGGR